MARRLWAQMGPWQGPCQAAASPAPARHALASESLPEQSADAPSKARSDACGSLALQALLGRSSFADRSLLDAALQHRSLCVDATRIVATAGSVDFNGLKCLLGPVHLFIASDEYSRHCSSDDDGNLSRRRALLTAVSRISSRIAAFGASEAQKRRGAGH